MLRWRCLRCNSQWPRVVDYPDLCPGASDSNRRDKWEVPKPIARGRAVRPQLMNDDFVAPIIAVDRQHTGGNLAIDGAGKHVPIFKPLEADASRLPLAPRLHGR